MCRLIFSNKFNELISFMNKRIKKMKREQLIKSTRIAELQGNSNIEQSYLKQQNNKSRDINRILKDSYDKSKVSLLIESLKQKELKYNSMKALNNTPTKLSQSSLSYILECKGIKLASIHLSLLESITSTQTYHFNLHLHETSSSCIKQEEVQTKSIIDSNRQLCASRANRNIAFKDSDLLNSAQDCSNLDLRNTYLEPINKTIYLNKSSSIENSRINECSNEYPLGCYKLEKEEKKLDLDESDTEKIILESIIPIQKIIEFKKTDKPDEETKVCESNALDRIPHQNIKEELNESDDLQNIILSIFDSELSQKTTLNLFSNTQNFSTLERLSAKFRDIQSFPSIKVIELNLAQIEKFGYKYKRIELTHKDLSLLKYECIHESKCSSFLLFLNLFKINNGVFSGFKLIRFKSNHSHLPFLSRPPCALRCSKYLESEEELFEGKSVSTIRPDADRAYFHQDIKCDGYSK